MFGIGIFEILVILIVAVIFLGPDKLPQAAIDLAKFIRTVKKTVDDAKESFDNEVRLSEIKKEALEYKESLSKDFNSLTSLPKDIANDVAQRLELDSKKLDSKDSQNIQKSPETLALESLNFQSDALDLELQEYKAQQRQEQENTKQQNTQEQNGLFTQESNPPVVAADSVKNLQDTVQRL
ncbi:MAG: Sec-independent protein translocase protein TatB [Helicobacter sp.]|nr:Sec-independent protein translocase protein TatB [Helicobacter sp.]